MSDINIARGYYYEFLSYPLFFSEDAAGFERFISQAKYLAQNPIDATNLSDFENILSFDFAKFKKEQNAVLFDFSYTNIPLTASFYHEGRDDGAKRLEVIAVLNRSKFRRDSDKCRVSEDYIGFIFKLMATLIGEDLGLSRELFSGVINDFSDEFASMLLSHQGADFFASYARIYASFVELERALQGIKAPKKGHSPALEAMNKKPFQTKMATPKSKIMWDEFTKI